MLRYALAVFFMGIAFTSFAQFTLDGYVKDENGEPYQFIEVQLEQSGQTCTTDINGYFQIQDIDEGIYAFSVDYLYDKQYYTVNIPAPNSRFDVILKRRISFDEVLVKAYQMELSSYSNAKRLSLEELQSLDKEKDLPYLLQSVAGVQVLSDAGNGVGYSGIRIRGIDPSHVQLNINGIPFNDSESSLSYFVDIPDIIAHTEEITIIKGNVPNRAGTPSFGASIDINTNKLAFEPYVHLNTHFGSFNSSKYSIQANSGLLDNKYNVEFGLSRQKSDGYIDRSNVDLKSFRFSAALVKKKYSLRFNYFHGSEQVGQAWYGLPIQYQNVDSLRQFNLAGTEKPGTPYDNEKDFFKQDHFQFFYQKELFKQIILNTSINYTSGSGYFENYKSNQNLDIYSVNSPLDSFSDLVARQWLQNDFIFVNAGLIIPVHSRISISPSVSWSYFSGDHFGQVSWVNLAEYNLEKFRYYENQGIKKEFSAGVKTAIKLSTKINLSADLQYRALNYRIDGHLMNGNFVQSLNQYQLFNPKLFFDYLRSKQWSFYSSIGFMQREPFREDILHSDQKLKAESLSNLEAGFKFKSNHMDIKVNGYYMHYKNQLALNGKLNEVGEALRINLDNSYRLGIELETEWKLSERLSVWNASNFSSNKISSVIESIPVYDGEQVFYEERIHQNSTISFSPSSIVNSGFRYILFKESRRTPLTELNLKHYIISDVYLDNFSQNESLLKGYQLIETSLNVQKTLKNLGVLAIRLSFYNLGNEKYSSHGWISKFKSTSPVDLKDNPYLGEGHSNIYFYKGVYPQALGHFNIGIRLMIH